MRLPAVTDRQHRQEDAREFHERLWRAHLEGAKVLQASAEGMSGRDLIGFSSAFHRFWQVRHFQMRCKQAQDKSGFWVWLTPR